MQKTIHHPYNPFLGYGISLIKKKQGFFIHASSLCLNEKALLFSGEGGSGKSTIAEKLSSKTRVIDDEHNYIVLTEKGPMTFSLSLNSHGYIDEASCTPLLPVSRLYLIKKEYTASSWLEPVPEPGTVWRFLLEQSGAYRVPPLFFRTASDLMQQFISAVPCFCFHHNMKDSASDILPVLTQ